jgi:hypothetical protein
LQAAARILAGNPESFQKWFENISLQYNKNNKFTPNRKMSLIFSTFCLVKTAAAAAAAALLAAVRPFLIWYGDVTVNSCSRIQKLLLL